jgi:hypothetical protein
LGPPPAERLRRAYLHLLHSYSHQQNPIYIGFSLLRTRRTILVLRHQLTVLQRRVNKPRLALSDRAFLAALLLKLPRPTLRRLSLIVSLDTVLRWHRDLLHRHPRISRTLTSTDEIFGTYSTVKPQVKLRILYSNPTRAGHGLRSHTRAVHELATAFRLALSHPATRERDQRPGNCRLAGRDPST